MMKIKKTLNLWIFFLLPLVCSPQVVIEDGKELITAVNNSPQEKVFIHFNTPFLLVGEYLYYKVYVLNSQSLTPSELSSVAYVELQGKTGEVVFKHKVSLENGVGEGDSFISTQVPSGNYKLLGYTRWMLNGEKNNIFQSDVVVVNPYTNDQAALLASTENDRPEAETMDLNKSKSTPTSKNPKSSGDLKSFGKREKVQLTLEGMEGLDKNGNYSLSVRKLHDIEVPKMMLAEDISTSGKSFRIAPGEKIFLPELRGELFTGKLAVKGEYSGLPVANRRVALSIPGGNFILKISRTNDHGEFFFNVEDYNLTEEVILQVLGEERGKYDIILETLPAISTSGIKFGNFQLIPEMEDFILQESIYNQIENGYFSAKADTLKLPEQRLPFYGNRMLTYDLDDYTRFNTIKETFVEIVRDITIAGEKLRIRGYNPLADSRTPPLLIVDGVIIQDHAEFINFPARRVQTIGVLRDKYFYGPEVFHGIISVETVERDFREKSGADFFTTTLLRPQPTKSYYKQTYSEEKANDRTPDFRRQLLWNPEFDVEEGSVIFYTSDVAGEYEVLLKGFTSSGKGVTLKENILVD